MKSAIKLLLLVTVTFLSASFKPIAIDPKDLIGAWGYGPENRKSVMIVTDHVFSIAIYDVPGKKMIGSYGGTWKIDNNIITGQMEWNSFDTTQAGENFTQEPQIKEGKLFLQGDEGQGPWIRLDDGRSGRLNWWNWLPAAAGNRSNARAWCENCERAKCSFERWPMRFRIWPGWPIRMDTYSGTTSDGSRTLTRRPKRWKAGVGRACTTPRCCRRCWRIGRRRSRAGSPSK